MEVLRSSNRSFDILWTESGTEHDNPLLERADLISEIFSHLDVRTLLNFFPVSKYFRKSIIFSLKKRSLSFWIRTLSSDQRRRFSLEDAENELFEIFGRSWSFISLSLEVEWNTTQDCSSYLLARDSDVPDRLTLSIGRSYCKSPSGLGIYGMQFDSVDLGSILMFPERRYQYFIKFGEIYGNPIDPSKDIIFLLANRFKVRGQIGYHRSSHFMELHRPTSLITSDKIYFIEDDEIVAYPLHEDANISQEFSLSRHNRKSFIQFDQPNPISKGQEKFCLDKHERQNVLFLCNCRNLFCLFCARSHHSEKHFEHWYPILRDTGDKITGPLRCCKGTTSYAALPIQLTSLLLTESRSSESQTVPLLKTLQNSDYM